MRCSIVGISWRLNRCNLGSYDVLVAGHLVVFYFMSLNPNVYWSDTGSNSPKGVSVSLKKQLETSLTGSTRVKLHPDLFVFLSNQDNYRLVIALESLISNADSSFSEMLQIQP